MALLRDSAASPNGLDFLFVRPTLMEEFEISFRDHVEGPSSFFLPKLCILFPLSIMVRKKKKAFKIVANTNSTRSHRSWPLASLLACFACCLFS